MMKRKIIFASFGTLFFIASPSHALKMGGHVKASLVSEVKSIQPGSPFWVAVRLEMEPHWHTYWKNAGESGAPTEITWKLPAGFKAAPTVWPVPKKIAVPPIVSYGYEEEVLLLAKITPPAVFQDTDPVRLAARVDWLECEVVCIPGGADVELALPVKIMPPEPEETMVEKFNATRVKVPLTETTWDIKAVSTPNGFQLTLTPPEGQTMAPITDLTFFAEDANVISYAAPQVFANANGGYTLNLVKSDASTSTIKTLRGVLVNPMGWRGIAGETALEIAVPVSAPAAATPTTPASSPKSSLWLAVLFSFVGGLILNLMPCVLPVLSIKVLGFVKQAKGNQRNVVMQGVVFAAGVLVSFWSLAGLLLFLRSGGQQLGWGFQLQSPSFVTCLASLFFVMGVSMLGVFEVGTSLIQLGDARPERALSGDKGGLAEFSGSFFSGVLATLVATPCTAPFMGSALGFALVQPAYVSFTIFTALGLGMASPYVILAASPALLKFVPKPGAWMETFKQTMGFLLIATVIWLLWVLGHQTGVDAVLAVLSGFLLQGVGGWMLGRWGTPVQPKPTRARALTFGTLLLIGGLAVALKGVKTFAETPTMTTSADAEKTGLEWQPYSVERIEELRRQGRIVLVDFSAAWCLTCQVNERVTLRSDAVVEALKKKNVALLKADWTSRDEKITQALQSFGRSGVPFYVVYPSDPNAPPVTLPEIITPQIVLDALEKIN